MKVSWLSPILNGTELVFPEEIDVSGPNMLQILKRNIAVHFIFPINIKCKMHAKNNVTEFLQWCAAH